VAAIIVAAALSASDAWYRRRPAPAPDTERAPAPL
jgi:hypothetical protein